MSQLTPAQQGALAAADKAGRALVTMIDGRIAIVLPPVSVDDAPGLISRVARALESALESKDAQE